MADLVTLAELKLYLGIDTLVTTDDTLLTQLLNDVEALFEAATLRAPGTYPAAGLARSEVLDGTGSRSLYLSYPVSVLTSISLGYDSASPTETLTVADKSVVVY